MLTTRRCRHDEGPPWCRAARLPQATLVTPLERIAGGPDDPEARLCSASKPQLSWACLGFADGQGAARHST
jgi:hypothetical protein